MYQHAQAHKENTDYRHTHTQAHTWMCAHMDTYTHVQDRHTHRHTSTEAYTHRHTHSQTHMCMQTRTHVQTQVHGHMHTQRHTDTDTQELVHTLTRGHTRLPTGTQQMDTRTQTCTHPQAQHMRMPAGPRPHSPSALPDTLSLQQFAPCAVLAPGLWAQALLVLLSLLGGAAMAPSLGSAWGAEAPGIACDPC